MSQPYSESSYDAFFCLKPPLLLWIAVLYLSRGFTLPIAMGIGALARVDERSLASFRALWSVDTLLPSTIAGIFLYTMVRRSPGAPRWVRLIWTHGRIWLAVAAGIDFVRSLMLPIQQRAIDDQTLLSLAAAAADAYFLAYILLAKRVRDAIAQFPLDEA